MNNSTPTSVLSFAHLLHLLHHLFAMPVHLVVVIGEIPVDHREVFTSGLAVEFGHPFVHFDHLVVALHPFLQLFVHLVVHPGPLVLVATGPVLHPRSAVVRFHPAAVAMHP